MAVATSFSKQPGGLITQQLWQAVKTDEKIVSQFGGVLASDQLTHVALCPNHRPRLYIVNTDPSWLPGRHWVVIYIPQETNAPAEFFDSLGKHPDTYSPVFSIFMNTFCRRGYVYYFAANRCHDIPMGNIFESIHSDNTVELFVKNYFFI